MLNTGRAAEDILVVGDQKRWPLAVTASNPLCQSRCSSMPHVEKEAFRPNQPFGLVELEETLTARDVSF
jgi:hypothetical protein